MKRVTEPKPKRKRERASRIPDTGEGVVAESVARWRNAAQRLGLSLAASELGAFLLTVELDGSARRALLGKDADVIAPRRAHLLAALTATLDERDVLHGFVELERRAILRQSDSSGPWMAGEAILDARVRHFCCSREALPPAADPSIVLAPRLNEELARIAAFHNPLVVIRGRRGSGRDTVLNRVAAIAGRPTTTRTTTELRAALDPLEPELGGAIAVWDARGSDPSPEDYPRAAQWLSRSATACIAVLDPHHDAPEISDRALVELRVDLADSDERHAMWSSVLDRAGVQQTDDDVARRLSARSRAGAGLASRATRAAVLPHTLDAATLTRALEQSLAAHVQPSSTRGVIVEHPGPDSALGSLVVCDSVSRALGHLLVLAKVRETAPDPVRRGVKAMFSGVSGTGKTLAARAIARELDLPLFRVDLASLVSKWLGETEKNLRQAFEAAESAGAVLLFDEGDSLFGKRGEVERGTDRYANLEVSYLLQALEAHDGIVIVTTNLKAQIDRAFIRRFDVCAEFQPPTKVERVLLWKRELGVAGDQLDTTFVSRELAQVDLTGGAIASAARLSRALARSRGEQNVRSDDVRLAVAHEFAKIGAGATIARWTARGTGTPAEIRDAR